MHIPAQDILHHLAKKDNKAYRYLYDAYYVALKSVAARYVRDDHTAEDMVQDTFISLLESSHRFTTVDEVKYFLYTALKNKCISHLRKEKVRERYQQDVLNNTDEGRNFWEQMLEEDVYAQLMAGIETLPPQCRLVMQLTLEGLKISEIAARMNIAEDTVKEYKKNGKQKLARMLENPFLLLLFA